MLVDGDDLFILGPGREGIIDGIDGEFRRIARVEDGFDGLDVDRGRSQVSRGTGWGWKLCFECTDELIHLECVAPLIRLPKGSKIGMADKRTRAGIRIVDLSMGGEKRGKVSKGTRWMR